jgi:hypothetical protein
MDTPPVFLTLKELDQRWQAAKGTAFKTFKQQATHATDGVDYHYFPAGHPEIARLKAEDRLYASSTMAVLVSEKWADTLAEIISHPSTA